MSEIVSLIGTVGFPIVMCLLMCFYINKINEDHKNEILNLEKEHKEELLELAEKIKKGDV